MGLYPLLPENVEVDRDEAGNLYYIYHAYTDEVPGENGQDIYFRSDEIFHIPGLGFNGLVGFSPIAMMKNSLGTTLAVEKYGASFFKNGAQPSGVLEHPGVLKDPGKIRENWSAVYGGANNAHKVAVLEEGMTYDPSTIAMGNARDMEKAISTLNEVKESIINAYAFKTGLTHSRIAKLMENETWMNAKKAVELGFADEILFEAVEPEEDPDEDDPDEGGDGADPEEEKEEGIHLTAQMYSSRQMGLTILNRLGVREEKPPSGTPTPPVEGKPPAGPKPPERPVLDMDGKTEDGSVPYNILLKQLECMR